jgi:hypothetical protein
MRADTYGWKCDRLLILIGTYDHHQEHLDKLLAWLKEHGEV